MKKINNVRRCRLCACEEDLTKFAHIFDDNVELELETKISKLLPVVVMPWDPMPHLICDKCIDKLNSFNEFYETSLKAERFLRMLHPSVPENELENFDPVVQVMDNPALNETSLKLPPKKRQGTLTPPSKSEKDASDLKEVPPSLGKHRDEVDTERALNCFIINQITNRDSVYTCRDCFRTFTKQSSALTHSCVRIEDCDEIETIDVEDDAEKSLPPLKIRLFSVRSGFFVCYLCQASFEEKAELVDHIKKHLLDGKWDSGNEGKCNKQKGKRKGHYEDENENQDEKRIFKKKMVKKKRKKCSEPPKKRGKSRTDSGTEECPNESCMNCRESQNRSTSDSSAKETLERIARPSRESEVPVQVRGEDKINNEGVLSSADKSGNGEGGENSDEPLEISNELGSDSKTDEVTVIEVINNKTSNSFSSCVFCDKIFATKDALIAHQNKHFQGCLEVLSEVEGKKTADSSLLSLPSKETFLCSVCAMMLTSKMTLLDHERSHSLDSDATTTQRKIRIALTPEFSDNELEKECQIVKGRGIITITVTSGEKTIPQIELI